MKSIVNYDEYHALDLRPSDLLATYIEKTGKDVQRLIFQAGELKPAVCPACRRNEVREAFMKFGLTYQECTHCGTLYISPRPDDDCIDQYYRSAESRRFWQDTLSSSTQKQRAQKIIKPRYEWIVDSTQEHFPVAQCYADIHMNHAGYLPELKELTMFDRQIILRPQVDYKSNPAFDDMTVRMEKNWDESLRNKLDVITLFEVLDRTADVDELIRKVRCVLKKDGLCFITAILSSGFDVQTLWESADNLFPPDRLNIFSAKGLQLFLDHHGFECLEFSTPGILDVELVKKLIEEDPERDIARFVRQIVRADEPIRREFQQFLQAHLLSSYGRILIRKKPHDLV